MRSALSEAGYEDLEVQRHDDRSFRIGSATVSTSKREAAAAVLVERLGAIERFRVTSAIDDAKSLIGRTAQLVFRERTCTSPQCIQFTDADIGLTGEDLSQAYAQADNVGIGWVVIIHFSGRGSDIFADLTCRIVGQPDKRIAFFLDREELLAPVAQACIRDGVTRITGNFTREEAKLLAIQLEAGSLPVPLRVIQEADVDALLGAESLRNSLIAGLIGLGLVMAFMMAYLPDGRGSRRRCPSVLCGGGAGRVQAHPHHLDPFPHRGLYPVHRYGGGRQRADLRTNEGGGAHRPDAGVVDGSRV